MKANTVVVISGRVCAPTVEYPEPSVLHEKQMAKFLSSCVPQLCWKLDRDIWAKVEAKEATTSWGREQSAIAICEAICDNGIGKCMKEQESQEELWGKALLIADMAQFRINHDGSCDYSEAISEIKKAGFTITKSNP